jgi:hypothetical protein
MVFIHGCFPQKLMKKYLNLLVAALLVVLGLGCFLGQTYIDPNVSPGWYTALGNIGSAVLICGLLTLLQSLITKHLDDANLRLLLGMSDAVKASSLRSIQTDSSLYDFKDLMLKSISFSVIMNDGLRWVGNHSVLLEKRFTKKTETEFFLVDPEGAFCRSLAIKTATNVEALKNKIEQSVALLESTYMRTNQKGTLRIYFMRNYPTQSLFFGDDRVVVTPYQASSGRPLIPLFEYNYEEGHISIASNLFDDLTRVRNESILISENGKRQTSQ